MRKLFLSIVVMLLAFRGAYDIKLADERPFVTYANNKPVVWKTGTPLCLSFNNRPHNLTKPKLQYISNYFTKLTGIEVNNGCKYSNVQIKFGSRAQLSYLKNNSAVGAAVALLNKKAKNQIIGGMIQIDELSYSVISDRTRFNLLLHELGHVIGFAHSHDGGLMMPVLTDIKHERYPKNGILQLNYAKRLLN